METLKAAASGSAAALVLCDTNGGSLPDEVREITEVVVRECKLPVGIHCHNDTGMAVRAASFPWRRYPGAGNPARIQRAYRKRERFPPCANLELKMGLSCHLKGRLPC